IAFAAPGEREPRGGEPAFECFQLQGPPGRTALVHDSLLCRIVTGPARSGARTAEEVVESFGELESEGRRVCRHTQVRAATWPPMERSRWRGPKAIRNAESACRSALAVQSRGPSSLRLCAFA